jgi:hypothetical protein
MTAGRSRLEVELELTQALVERIVGEAQPTRQPPRRGRVHLGRQEPLEDLDRRAGLVLGAFQFSRQGRRRGGQAQIGEVLAGPGVRGSPGLRVRPGQARRAA